VQDVTFNPDGGLIAAAGADAAIRLWDVATGTRHGNPVTGFTSWINDIAFTPDGRTIASAADEGLQLWDVETGQARGARLQEGARSLSVAIGPNGYVVAAAGEEATTTWDLRPELLVSQACDIANRNLSQPEWERFMPASTPPSRTCPQP
jgi:WD40 repeat protein